MITQNLIDLIHSGKAKYQTWTAGYTGSFRIPVPKNNYIVITDFTFFNFMDQEPDPEPGPEPRPKTAFDPLKSCIHNVLFKSYGNEFLYVHRSNFIGITTDLSLTQLYVPLQNTDKYDTYQVHKSDVRIDCWRIPPTSENKYAFNLLNDKTTETDGPQGYGTVSTPNANSVIKAVALEDAYDSSDVYTPYGENQGSAFTPFGYSEKLRSHINGHTALQPPYQDLENLGNDGMFTFPLFNIGYVLVNEAFDKTDR
jgi:hypothetical protein